VKTKISTEISLKSPYAIHNEKIQSAALKDDLIKQISALLLNFTTTHSRNIDSAMQPVLQQNLAGITHLRAFEERYVTKAQL
jgi:hypothetical protein